MQILTFQMQIPIIQQGLKSFESKFETIERNSKHSKSNSNIRKGFEAFKCKFKEFESDSNHLNANSNYSKDIRSIPMQIRTIWKGFEALKCKF